MRLLLISSVILFGMNFIIAEDGPKPKKDGPPKWMPTNGAEAFNDLRMIQLEPDSGGAGASARDLHHDETAIFAVQHKLINWECQDQWTDKEGNEHEKSQPHTFADNYWDESWTIDGPAPLEYGLVDAIVDHPDHGLISQATVTMNSVFNADIIAVVSLVLPVEDGVYASGYKDGVKSKKLKMSFISFITGIKMRWATAKSGGRVAYELTDKLPLVEKLDLLHENQDGYQTDQVLSTSATKYHQFVITEDKLKTITSSSTASGSAIEKEEGSPNQGGKQYEWSISTPGKDANLVQYVLISNAGAADFEENKELRGYTTSDLAVEIGDGSKIGGRVEQNPFLSGDPAVFKAIKWIADLGGNLVLSALISPTVPKPSVLGIFGAAVGEDLSKSVLTQGLDQLPSGIYYYSACAPSAATSFYKQGSKDQVAAVGLNLRTVNGAPGEVVVEKYNDSIRRKIVVRKYYAGSRDLTSLSQAGSFHFPTIGSENIYAGFVMAVDKLSYYFDPYFGPPPTMYNFSIIDGSAKFKAGKVVYTLAGK